MTGRNKVSTVRPALGCWTASQPRARGSIGLLNVGYCDVKMQHLFRNAVFFVLRTKNAVDGVWSAMAGFVVVADLHFSQQADG